MRTWTTTWRSTRRTQWTLQPLTLNLGLRLDWISQSLGAVDHPANALFPAYSSPGARAHAELEGPEPAYRRGLRPVRQRQHRDQGRDQPLRGREHRPASPHCTGRLPTPAPPATGPTPTRNFFPDCDLKNPAAQDLRGPGGDVCGVYNTPSVGTYVPSTECHRPRLHRWLVQARLQLARHGLRRAADRKQVRGGGHLCPRDLRQLHRDRQPEPHAGRLRSVLHHGAGGSAPAAERPAVVRALRSAHQRRDQQPDRLRRQLRRQYQFGNLEQRRQTEQFNGFDVQLLGAASRRARSPVAGARATRFRTRRFRPTAARSTTASPIASSWTTPSS